jgi:hypothetical protein
MIIRRNFLQGLAAGAATVSMTPRSALAIADSSIRRARDSVKYLDACVIACEESGIPDDSNILDYWTFNLSDIYETWLPEGCRKVVIADNFISSTRAVRDIVEIYQSIPRKFDFDPMHHPNHCVLHVEGVTDFQGQIRSVLATKSKRAAKSKVAVVSEDSFCLHFSVDWPSILPVLRTHYDRIISLSDVGFDENSEFYDAEYEAYKKERHEQIAAHCDISVRLPLPDYSADEFDDEHTTNLICEIADSILLKTSAEVSELPSCGDIPFRDFMTLVA